MRRLFTFGLVSLCLVICATSALADKQLEVRALSDVQVQVAGEAMRVSDCVVGNTNDPAYAITDWVYGAESYAQVAWPFLECGVCPLGFQPTEVHLLVQFGPEDVPVTFDAAAGIATATSCSMPICCDSPLYEYCVSDVYSITIDTPGLYDLALPVTCDCAFVNYVYFLTFHFLTPFGEAQRPDLVTDDVPRECVSFNDYGAGWEDLNGYGFPGSIVMYADAACCEQPVNETPSTWGGVKSLYR
ncbi:MAG: hypothetical protein ABIF77_21690 [bacterium]